MATGGGFRGVSAGQDARFSNKEKRELKSMKFPKELDAKIDPKKVNWTVMKEWIARRVTELLGGLEEEVLISLIYNYLEADKLDGKQLHVTLTPFLEKNTSLFMKELWSLLASANQTASHIPKQLLEAEAAKHAALLQQQQAIQAQVEKARAEAQAKMMQQLPPPPAQPPAASSGRHDAGASGSRWNKDRQTGQAYDRNGERGHGRGSDKRGHDRDSRDSRDRELDRRRSERDARPESHGSGQRTQHDRDRDRARDGDRVRDVDRRDSRRRRQSRSRSRSKSRSPSRSVSRGSRSASPRRRRSRSPQTMRERMRRQARHSQSPDQKDDPEKDKREESPAEEPPNNKKRKHKKDKKSKKHRRYHSSSPSKEDVNEHGETSALDSEGDEDLQVLMQRALESAKHKRMSSGEA